MDDDAMRAAIAAHFTAIGRDQDEAGAIYADDAVLEYVQSGERIVGRDSIVATRKAYPGGPRLLRRAHLRRGQPVGGGAGAPLRRRGSHFVAAILEVRDGQVTRRPSTSPNHGTLPRIEPLGDGLTPVHRRHH